MLVREALKVEAEVVWISWVSSTRSAGFYGPCVCLGVFLSVFVVKGDFFLGIARGSKVDIVVWSACDECVGVRGSLVKACRRMR
jgi:hypothetical protein